MSLAPVIPSTDPLLDNLGAAQLPVTLARGHGARVTDTRGRAYWDFYGGHAVTLLGQAHPRWVEALTCLLYTSPSPRDLSTSRMPSSA